MVLSKAGDQVPVIPLLEVVGNAVNRAPVHTGVIGLNPGTIKGFIVTDVVAIAPGQPPLAAIV